MLRFACSLTAAATVLVAHCFEVAADDLAELYESDEDYSQEYPLSSRCFTRALARATLLDMLDKLQRPEEYIPTDYHWLLLYECLQRHIAQLNDLPMPDLVAQLRAVAHADDGSYLRLPRASRRNSRCRIDFDALVDRYFWDTDFLLDAETFDQLDAAAKQRLGFTEGVFGVVQGLSPHPDELVLRRSDTAGLRPSQSEEEEADA